MVYHDWNRWNDEGFTFLGSDVSTSWVYLLSQMLFWQLMYLHCLDIHCCRCYFLDRGICKAWYSLLQMLFLRPRYLQLAFLWTCRCFSACLSCTIASTSCLFWDLKILPSQILHLHPTFSITWGCSPVKFRILNLFFLYLADTSRRNFASSTCPFYTLQIHPTEFLHPHFQKIHYHKYLPYSLNSMTWADTLLTKKLI